MDNLRTFFTLLVLSPFFVHAEVSGTWEQELVYSTGMNGLQKFESLIEPEWNSSIGEVDITAIVRIRLDTEAELGPSVRKPNNFSSSNGAVYAGDHGEWGLREFYFDAEWAGRFWRIGKQQVVWGQADGLKVLDKINPQSFREFILDDFDDSRIPLWMVNLEIPFNDDALQILWIPDSTGHELPEPGTPFDFTRPTLIPRPPVDSNGVPLLPVVLMEGRAPGSFFKDSDLGLRYSLFTETGWDVTLNYLYHYDDLPVLYQDVVSSGTGTQIDITFVYKRSHLLGATLSNAFGDFTFRGELGYSTNTYHVSTNRSTRGIGNSPETAWVLGLDYQGISDTFLSVQWFQSHLSDYSPQIIRDQTRNTITALLQRDFINETWGAEILAIHNFNDEDGLVRPKVSHQLNSNLELWSGADLFYGDNDGLFGQFDRQDRMLFGFELGL